MNLRIISSLYLIFLCSLSANAQFHQWTKGIGGASYDYNRSICNDSKGNVYSLGYFQGTVDFDPGIGVSNLTSLSSSGDLFLLKLDSLGNFLWVKRFDPLVNGGHNIHILCDSSNNVLLMGTTGDQINVVDVDPGPGVYNVGPGWGTCVIKLSESGNFLWAQYFDGLDILATSGNSDCDIFFTGYMSDTVDIDPGPLVNLLTLQTFSNWDIVVGGLDSNGSLLWGKNMNFPNGWSEFGHGITVDNEGSIYVSGEFTEPIDFDLGPGVFTLNPANGDGFLWKMTEAGNFIWAINRPVRREWVIYYDGNLYLSGTRSLSKVDTAGNQSWSHSYTNNVFESFLYGTLTVDDDHNLYWVCSLLDSIDIDPSPNVHMLVNINNYNGACITFSKWDSTGNLLFANTYLTNTGNTGTNVPKISSYKNSIYCSGHYQDTTDFNLQSGVYNLPSNGLDDVFITKMNNYCQNSSYTIYDTACNSYLSPSSLHVWDSSGTYIDTIIISANCTEIATVHLSILNSTFATINPSVCHSYTSPSMNHTWTTSGTYTDTIVNSAGCDSIITINLSVNNSSSTINPSVCYSYTSPSTNYTWTTSGTYTDTITNAAGCDSIITIHLTVNNSSSIINPIACGSYLSPSSNYTWTTSGSYIDTITNGAGCDSLITINLTVNNNSFSTINPQACNSYISPSSNYTWTSSGTYLDTIINSVGCDSILTINLTIGSNSGSTINISSCNSLLSPSQQYLWTSTGTYYDTIPNSFGCDSFMTVNFNLDSVDISVIQNVTSLTSNQTNAQYQWLNCDNGLSPMAGATGQTFTPSASGNYAVQVTRNNCIDTSNCYGIQLNVSVHDYERYDQIKFHPNPTNDIVYIDSKFPIKNIQLVTVTGEMLSNVQVQDPKGQIMIDLSKFSSGVYFVRIKFNETDYLNYKIIKK